MIAIFESVRQIREAPFPRRVATATIFAVATIESAIERFVPWFPDEIIVSGGGTRNELIMDHLLVWSGRRARAIEPSEVLSEAKEALAFALLGAATLDGVPSNVPSVTGARRAVVLGSITPKP
jgi:anhydro-N-acetylmuramic acid kinase